MLREKLKTGLLKPLLLLAALLALSQSVSAWNTYYLRPAGADYSASDAQRYQFSWQKGSKDYQIQDVTITRPTVYSILVCDNGNETSTGWAWFSASSDHNNVNPNVNQQYDITGLTRNGTKTFTLQPGVYTLYMTVNNDNFQDAPTNLYIKKTAAVKTQCSYYVNYQKEAGNNDSWDKQCETTVTFGKSVTFAAQLKKGAHFGFKNDDEVFYGPSSTDMAVNYGDQITSFSINDKHFVWNGPDGKVNITVTFNTKGEVTKVQFLNSYTLRGSWGDTKTFTNNTFSFGAGNYVIGSTFNLYRNDTKLASNDNYDDASIARANSSTTGYNFKLATPPGAGDNVVFTIKMENGNPVLYAQARPVYYSYSVQAQITPGFSDCNGSWGTVDGTATSLEGGRSGVITAHLRKGTHFGLLALSNNFYGPSGNKDVNVTFNSNTTFTTFGLNNRHFIWDDEDADVEIHVTLGPKGAITKIEFKRVTPKVTYYLHSGDKDAAGWNSTKSVQVPVGGSAEFTAYMYPTYNFTISGNGTYYGSVTDVVFTDGVESTDIITDDIRKDYQWRGGTGPVTVTITIDEDGKLVKILANGPAVGEVVEGHKARPVYLLAQQLNGEKESPEWQMEHMGEGVYTLRNFAMRPYDIEQDGDKGKASVPFIRLYDENGENPRDIKFETDAFKATLPQKNALGGDDKGGLSPGWAYNATFYFDTETLTMAPVSGATPNMESSDILPFVGILGEYFRQSTEYTTPIEFWVNNDKRDPNNHKMGNTSLGWQEAYIQYDANGNPVLDDNNVAYYNTYWPPRHNILMVSEVSGEQLPTSTKNLTFLRDSRVMTGSEWKEQLQKQGGDNYNNLSLVENQNYVRYSVSNMWMLGTFKVWTGWPGYTSGASDWGAFWNSHRFWGASLKSDGDDREVVPYVVNTCVDAPGNQNGRNFQSAKTYYKTMELFLPVTLTNGNLTAYDFYNAKLYSTLSAGGASIDSKGDNARLHAGYKPALNAWPAGFNLTSYKVVRHKYNPNAEIDSYDACDKDGVVHYDDETGEVVESAGLVTSKTGISYSSAAAFNNDFSFAADGALEGYVDDGKYAPGMYIYSLEVTFQDSGKTLTDVVWSPYVQLVDTNVEPNLTCAQLIELDDANTDGTYDDYTHITFNPSYDGLLVKIERDGRVSKAARLSSYMSQATAAEIRKRCAEIYEIYGRWTNKALLSTSIPTSYTQQGGKRSDITTFGIYTDAACTKAVANGTNLHTSTPVNGNYYRVYNRAANFSADFPFYAKFVGKVGETTVGQDAKATALYTTRFPLPRLGEPNFDLITSDDPINVQVSHEALQGSVVASTVANSLNFDIPVAMPRVSLEGSLAQQVYRQLHFELDRMLAKETQELEGDKELWAGSDESEDTQAFVIEVPDGADVTKFFDVYSNEDVVLHYDAQSPFDWMTTDDTKQISIGANGKEEIVDFNGNPDDRDYMTDRVWVGLLRSWRVDGSKYKTGSGITGYVPRLFADRMNITLNCSFYTPTVIDAHVFKVNVPALDEEGNRKPNTFVCRVYLMDIKWGKPKDSSIGMSKEELKEDYTSLPVAFTDTYTDNNAPLYAVVARRNEGGQNVAYATSILTLDNSVNAKELFLLWESPEFHWYAEMDSFDPGISLLVSRAYAFYAANDERGADRRSHFTGVLAPQTDKILGSSLAIRYDYKAGEVPDVPDPVVNEEPAPSQAPMRIMRRVGENEGAGEDEVPDVNDPVIGGDSGSDYWASHLNDGDNAFLFIPRYADATGAMGQIQTSIDILDATEAGIEAGVGYIDVKGQFAMIFDAAGKMVYLGDDRVEVPAGVYIVNLHKGAVKVIVR